MTDKTLGEYKRTTPDPDETTGEALARLQAELTRLLDEADAELRDEADGGVAAALIEKEAEENDAAEARTLTPDAMTAREHLDAAWEAAHVPADGIIPAGAGYLWRSSTTGRVVQGVPDVEDASAGTGGIVERRLLDPARPEGAEEIERLIREANREGEGVADKLADRLASRGFRVVTEDGAA